MIPLIELRYGNFIQDKNNKEICINHISDIVMIGQSNEKYFGIPITKEWLKRMGFKDELFYYLKYGHDQFKYLAYYNNYKEVWAMDHEFDEVLCIASSIDYVHQLQNIFSALNNREQIIIK